MVGIPRDIIVEQLIEASGFGGSASSTLGHVNLDMNASSHSILFYRCLNHLSFVGREPYTKMSIPRITNALKTSGKARKSMSTPLNAFSNEMKLNSLEAAFFDKMAKDGEVAPAQPRGSLCRHGRTWRTKSLSLYV